MSCQAAAEEKDYWSEGSRRFALLGCGAGGVGLQGQVKPPALLVLPGVVPHRSEHRAAWASGIGVASGASSLLPFPHPSPPGALPRRFSSRARAAFVVCSRDWSREAWRLESRSKATRVARARDLSRESKRLKLRKLATKANGALVQAEIFEILALSRHRQGQYKY